MKCIIICSVVFPDKEPGTFVTICKDRLEAYFCIRDYIENSFYPMECNWNEYGAVAFDTEREIEYNFKTYLMDKGEDYWYGE